MPIWTKVSGVWKQIDKYYTKVSGAWKEASPVKINVSGTWRTAHQYIEPFYYPTNAILPYWGNISSLPSGWAQYTSCPDQYMPIGVNTWSLGQATGSGAVTLTSSSTANHGGNQYLGYGCNGVYCQGEYAANLTAAGGHNHTVTFNPHDNIPKLAMPFIRATSNRQEHPAYGLAFGYGTNLSSTGLSIVNFGGTNFFIAGRGSAASNQAIGDHWNAGLSGLGTNSYGGHYHRGVLCYDQCYYSPGSGIIFHAAGGSHSHTVTMYASHFPQYRALAAWWTGGNTVSNVGGYGTMVMYPSATAPARWSICNGTNGTPDMRDRFGLIAANASLGGWAGGDFYPTWSGTTNAAGSHNHVSWFLNYYSSPLTYNYHDNNLGNETHSFNDSRWWAPNLWGIYWIMYTG
jgi:hypothetical protein